MVSGTATSGIDYTLSIPNVITFQPGETKLLFPIAPIPDGEVEGTETIVITLTNNFGCGSVTYKTLTIYLEDNVVVEVNGGDTLLICAGKPFQLQATGATEYFWSPPGLVSNPLISNPVVNPSNDGWVEVTGSISSCVDKDSVYLKIINPTVELVALSPTNICLGQSVTLEAINNTGGQGISWEPAALVNNPTAAITEVRPGQTTLIKVSVEVGGCLAFDTLTIRVDTLFFPDFISADTTICQNYAVQLATLLNSSTDYQWSPASGLSNDTISGPLATPEFSTTYVLTATSSQGYCSQQDSVTITVIPANIDISGVDYREICLGDTLDLQAVITPAGASVAWTPSFYLSSATGTQVKAFPDESVTIRARYKINGCDVVDSIKIRVDSLPYSIIQRVPDKSVYCPSDTIYLLTPAYEPSSFPDIDLFWPQSFSQQLTPPDKWNMVVAANKTDTLIRDITNRGCFVRDSIIIPVGIIPVFTFSVDPPTLCPGESAQITATVDPPDVIVEWDESPTLSCLKCLNPVANPAISTTYTLQAPEADCPSSASVTVPVLPIASIGLVPSQTICFGQSVVLNNLPAEPGVFYVWTSSPPGQPLDGAQPTVTPGQTTTYTLVADGPAVCPATASTTLTVEPQTFVAATFSPPTLCPGQSAQITAQVQPSGTAFEWVGAGLSCTDCLNPVATPTETTTYLLKSINTGCPAQTSITIPVLPVAQLLMTPSQSLCFGQSVLLNQAAEEPGVNYTWTSTPPGLPINGGQPTVIPDQTTTYTVVASGAGFCSNTGQVTITVVPQTYVNATYSPAQVCPGDLVQITAVVQPQGTPVEWSGVGLSCTNCLNPTLSPDATAVYLVKTTETICPAEANITIPVQPVAKLQVIDDVTICLGASVNLNLNPDEPGVDYTWTATPGGIFSIEAQPVVTPIATTTFSVNAQGNGICKNTDTVVVKVVNAMVDAGSNQSTCAGAMVTLGATTTGTIGGIFVWNPGNLSGSSPVVSPTVPTTYQVFYNYGPNNSCSATDTMRVSIAPSTEITDFVALPESGSTICLGAGVVIKASITPETATLLWKENGEIIDGVTTDSVRLVPVTEGPVNLRLVATNAFGCKDSADVSYITERCFEMPNVFTPSGDAVNDTFGPLFFGGTATVVKFQIFNRWGQMVFDGVEGQSTWDGRYEGKDAPSDVYVYKITVRFSNGEEELRGGQVTLLR
jgi:gliding motility-associated-like protein